eukprot:CAMPEP_0196669072 /NCGR_PEP_ID=MMETSP1090-20130531/384_1 /TAXON_ID=37098 /ORGANISM="Isochrysis sp, Strain CCMP1244" /LENGTH=249 /DNA_ID=CAMNT_0042006569 /DNA_START=16 /DNA_END=765 /DNA_ORIENTATION=+
MGAEADNALALMPAPSFAAEPQETLLDVVLKQRGEKSLQPLCRLCLAGSSNASQGTSVGDWHQSTVRKIDASGESDLEPRAPLTGLLLTLPSGWIHFLEGHPPSMSEYLQQLTTAEAAGILSSIKVVSCMDDAPARSFGDWLACSVEVARGNYMDVDDDTLPKLLADTVIAFLQLGKAVGEDTAETASQKLAEWETRYSDFMPSNERVSQLLALDELPTLQEFIDTYESSEEVSSMSEVVWPAEPTLAY